uniref:Uncharacterized protein n=1 Tax=Plectus sambesii TaxID=2011161 RepID=A0A914XG45_9BILA
MHFLPQVATTYLFAIQIYLRLCDHPYDPNAEDGNEANKLSKNELKKQKRMAKKAATKEEADKGKQDKQQSKKADPELDGVQPEPLDPDQLLKTDKPLEEAAKFVEPLIQLNSDQIGAYILGFEVYYRKAKILPMLQCLKRGAELDPTNPKLHVCRVKFLMFNAKNTFDGPVGEILEETIPVVFPSTTDARELNEQFKRDHGHSFPHRLAIGEVGVLFDPATSETVLSWLSKSIDDEKVKGRTWKNCLRFVRYAKAGRLGPLNSEQIDQLARRCQKPFKDTTAFGAYLKDGNTAQN